MISALRLLATVMTSMLIVRMGAIALEMTGLDREKARFQSLSCFSGTGFTTREAEQIVNHPQRRRIATFLMILGNAGIVAVITTFVVSSTEDRLVLSLRNVGLIAGGLVGLAFMIRSQRFMDWIGRRIRHILQRRAHIEEADVTELLHQAEGYGVARLSVSAGSILGGKTLASSGLRSRDILVLSVERGEALMPLPSADRVIHEGDHLICYGPIKIIREYSQAAPAVATEGASVATAGKQREDTEAPKT